MHTHTSMHVGMYDCMRSESESELANQLSGILRKTNKQTSILVCLWYACVCVYEERERISVTLVTTAVQGCASDLCMCVRARVPCVCWYYFANRSTVSVCLPVHTVTQNTHTHIHKQHQKQSDTNTSQEIIEKQHLHSSTVFQYPATRNTHTH
jgi:hypothetical protein